MNEPSKQTKLQHLFWRAGFGASPPQVRAAMEKPLSETIAALFQDANTENPLDAIPSSEAGNNRKALRELIRRRAELSAEEKKAMVKDVMKENRGQIGDLNFQWLDQMGLGAAALREKMTLFWHGHFACRSRMAGFVQQQHNTIRRLALGKFGNLLRAVSQDPAMLQFLNNQQNKKDSPNENFAREVMELFTMGRGAYTEKDIKEAARAFTGWGFVPASGEFVFRKAQHDDGRKTIFGKTGAFDGNDVLDFLLQRPETSRFVVTKMYRYFVNDTPNEAHIAPLAERFRRSDYDIAGLMRAIFSADWFYDSKNLGAKIKSPVELLAGLQRNFGLEYGGKQSVLFIQKALDQVLFYPPNVAGWPGGRSWIDSSSLLLRMKLPEILFNGAVVHFKAKEEGDVNTEFLSQKGNKVGSTTVDWPAFEAAFQGLQGQALLDAMSAFLLQRPLAPAQQTMLLKRIKENPIRDLALAMTMLPEYQVC